MDRGVDAVDTQIIRRSVEILPSSGDIVAAFRGNVRREHPGAAVLEIAADLAAHHRRLWSAGGTAAAWEVEASRVALVEKVDEWSARELYGRADACVHTETLGSVVDRLASTWVCAFGLIGTTEVTDRTSTALWQLAELADAYDDLIHDVASGHRRLPVWAALVPAVIGHSCARSEPRLDRVSAHLEQSNNAVSVRP